MLKIAELIYSTPDSLPQDHKTNNLIPFINYQTPAPQRCLDMLLAKYYDKPFQSEVIMTSPDKPSLPCLKKPLNKATILLVTDGGLVPKNNPDHIPSTSSDKFGIYSIENTNSLAAAKYEVSHQGYDSSYVEADPNRLLPVDSLRELEMKHVIGKLYDFFISTTGVMTSTEKSIRLGKRIAQYVSTIPVDAVLITSACGTSTRCGSYIGIEIEKKGIPVVQITNLTRIAADTGIVRILKGNNICYPFGYPSIAEKRERIFRRHLVLDAVRLLTEVPAN